MGELIAALDRSRHTMGVTAVTRTARGWRLAGGGGPSQEYDAVVVAVPAWRAAQLVAALDGPARGTLADVRYHPSVSVSLAYAPGQIVHPLDAAGVVVAPGVASVLRACTFASSKFPGRAPAGHALLRAFLAPGPGDPAAAAHAALAPILGIAGAPLWSRLFEWRRGIPRYAPEHAERIAGARRRLARLGPIALAGAGYDGAGVSACVRSGRAAARELLTRM
jgi:oxygen-dependent protoporphyrinogen oxidase